MRNPNGTFHSDPLDSADTLRQSYLTEDRWIVEVEYLLASGLDQLRNEKQRTEGRDYYAAALMVLEAYRRICAWLRENAVRKEAPTLLQRLVGKRNEREDYVRALYQMTVGVLHTYGFTDSLAAARSDDAPMFASIQVQPHSPSDWIDGVPPDIARELDERHKAFQTAYDVVVASGKMERFEVVDVIDISPHGSFQAIADAGSYAFALSSPSRLVVIADGGKVVDAATARTLLDWARKNRLLTHRARFGTARPEGVLPPAPSDL